MIGTITNRMQTRTILGYLLVMGGAAVWFAPIFDDRSKTLVGVGLKFLSSLVAPAPERSKVDQLPPIPWRDRDAGQQFTIMMFHVVMLALVGFLAFQIASEVDGFVGNVLAATLSCAATALTFRNWKNRNARR